MVLTRHTMKVAEEMVLVLLECQWKRKAKKPGFIRSTCPTHLSMLGPCAGTNTNTIVHIFWCAEVWLIISIQECLYICSELNYFRWGVLYMESSMLHRWYYIYRRIYVPHDITWPWCCPDFSLPGFRPDFILPSLSFKRSEISTAFLDIQWPIRLSAVRRPTTDNSWSSVI